MFTQVVNVWEFGRGKDKKSLHLKQPLYGHTEAVTCVAASPTYNIIVSGSRDRTCLMWDLNQLVFVRQLRGHAAPVAAICINELTVSGGRNTEPLDSCLTKRVVECFTVYPCYFTSVGVHVFILDSLPLSVSNLQLFKRQGLQLHIRGIYFYCS